MADGFLGQSPLIHPWHCGAWCLRSPMPFHFPAPFLTEPGNRRLRLQSCGAGGGGDGVRTRALPQRLRDVVFVILGLTIGQVLRRTCSGRCRTWPVTTVALGGQSFCHHFFTRAAADAVLVDGRGARRSCRLLPGILSYVLGLSEVLKW